MDLYGQFMEKGYRVKAFLPSSDREPLQFTLRISIGDELKHTLTLPMVYPPRFGVDVGDLQALEGVTQRLMALLPEASEFNAETEKALTDFQATLGRA